MTLSELEQALFNLWPRRYAAAWDNVGMQAGDRLRLSGKSLSRWT